MVVDTKNPRRAKARRGSNKNVCGGVLLSHTLPGAVPSPCQALASGFGKGPGVTPGPWPPQKPPPTARTPQNRDPDRPKGKTTHAPPPARAVTVREPDSGREHRFVTTGTTLLVANNPAAAKTRTHPHTQEGEWAAMSPSPVSTGRLHPSRGFHLRPIKHVFHMRASGPRRAQGILISEQASRLDAFSGYPSRT